MFHRNLYLNYSVRLILITIFIVFLVIAIYHDIDYLTIGNLIFFTLLQIFLLLRKMNKVNQELINFFETIHNEDSNIVYSKKQGNKLVEKLYSKFDEINRMIQEVRIEHASQYNFLQVIIHHVNVGLMLFNEKGEIDLINNAAKELLSVSDISNINQLAINEHELPSILMKLEPGKVKTIQLRNTQSLLKLTFRTTIVKIKDESMRLVSLQNIKSELEQHEMETWQKLIRILTHEIMNSTAPISSSIKVIMQLLTDNKTGASKKLNELTQETIDHVVNGLGIIEDRSEGLNEFVNNYRSLTQRVKPFFKPINLQELILGVGFLVKDELEKAGIQFIQEDIDPEISIYADKKLLEQVLLNLVKNAKEALMNQTNGQITLFVKVTGDIKTIHIIDNGPGISREIQDQIFIPFFSTKEKGTGIGLSLSREIMKQNGGDLTFNSEPGKTEFILAL